MWSSLAATQVAPLASASIEPGTVLENRYVVLRYLARGGACCVYAATHRATERTVALKIIAPEHAGDFITHERLKREALALNRAKQKGVVELIDAGEHQGLPYLVLDHLEGRTLRGLLTARGRLEIKDAVHVGRHLAQILVGCHRATVIHRDVKPDNVFVQQGAKVVLLDFGIAKVPEDPKRPESRKLSRDGGILGTPEYSSPEALRSLPTVDQRSDIYAFGVLMFEILTGIVPFEGTYAEVLLQLATKPIPSLAERRPDAPIELVTIVDRCRAKDPDDRYQTAGQLVDAFNAWLGALTDDTAAPPSAAAQTSPAAKAAAAAGPAGREARRFPRAPYITPAQLTINGSAVSGRIEEISEGGAQFITSQPIAAQTKGTLRFALPISGAICSTGVVSRWTRAGRANCHATGFQFEPLASEAKGLVTRYIELMGVE